jgi:hypothetical protein
MSRNGWDATRAFFAGAIQGPWWILRWLVESVIMGVPLWIYAKLVTEPLRAFYFIGPIWWNQTPSQMCFQLSGVDPSFWSSTESGSKECELLLSKKFNTFETTVMCLIYSASITFLLLYTCCRCLFVAPVIREIRLARASAR